MNFNKLLFPWKPEDVQLGTISKNAHIGDYYRCDKFHACIKKCTICLKFRAMPPDYKGSLLSWAGRIGTPSQSDFKANSYWLLKQRQNKRKLK